ncbi:hypothetical protein [Rhodovibrio salinarum]|uniref:Uncharacterized protein n=1 Tax=Rhodovibrio salinarum TaxID=1087 RepID=A0A934QLU5_9PROT|nr:hypothetical protein [Rhodovibrio salinarum]MBK1699047.1 hypothetical protein [Rhodovibrio salinarum]
MQVPNGQVSPGLSFFRALEGLAKPQQPGQAAQAKAAAKPTDPAQIQGKTQSDAAQAARPTDPSASAARAAADGTSYPRGTFLDIRV